MHYLYASKRGGPMQLVATFGSEQQALAYVRWATLKSQDERTGKFEQGSVLAGYDRWDHTETPLNEEPAGDVIHNPTPTML